MCKTKMVERNKPQKICIAIHGLAHAGAERVAASWANYLANCGHDVFVLVYACSENTYDLDEKVRVIPLAVTQDVYFRMSKWKQLASIRQVICQEKPHQIISFLPKMQISMMLATIGIRARRIETVRNNPWADRDVEGKRFLWNMCFRRSDAIIVQTEEQALYFPQRLKDRTVVISNPVSGEFAQQQKVYGAEGVRRFVAVARLNKQKNYPMMIRAFATVAKENPECTLDIYGGGTNEAIHELQMMISLFGMEDKIRLCGWTRDISKLLQSYDAFLLSSDYEGMPNALAEAMAVGLVCLSTDCKTGPKDMIEPGKSGFLARTGDEKSFTEGIKKITQMNMQQCVAMGEAARVKILGLCNEKNTLERLKGLIETKA